MTFFARPNLDSLQFQQLSGTTLTLDGQTIITSVSGLSLTGDGGSIPIIVTGETNGYVLTYSSTKNQIELAQSSASGSSTIYNCTSPTTCTVGGLNSLTSITGCDLSRVLELILAPTLAPTCVANSNTLSLTPSGTLFEAGCQIAFTACGTYSQGSVVPAYCGGPSVRTGLPSTYNYTDIGGVICNVSSSSLTNSVALASRAVQIGNNVVYGNVSYLTGDYPKKSDGTIIGMTCCAAGTTSPSKQITITGVYPYFWGSTGTTPTIGQALINNACTAGNVCIGHSTGDTIVTNYNTTGNYIWLAIPATSTAKTKWIAGNFSSNTGTISGDLFSAATTAAIDSPSSCWSSVNYCFYVSNYPTSINYSMTFKNS